MKNPSFEKYKSFQYQYPCSPCDNFYSCSWNVFDIIWNSPDFYVNNDSVLPAFKAPINPFGYHPAKEGLAYIGLFILDWDGSMEHITGELIHPLKKGKKYKVEFYVRFAGNACRLYSKYIGLKFSDKFLLTTLYDYSYFVQNKLIADISNQDTFITNYTEWTKISGVYTAKGEERYITIGMFYQGDRIQNRIQKYLQRYSDNSYTFTETEMRYFKKHQEVLKLNPNYEEKQKVSNADNYYFIDEVSVIPLNE